MEQCDASKSPERVYVGYVDSLIAVCCFYFLELSSGLGSPPVPAPWQRRFSSAPNFRLASQNCSAIASAAVELDSELGVFVLPPTFLLPC